MSKYLYTDELETELAELEDRDLGTRNGDSEIEPLEDDESERLDALRDLFESIGTGLSASLIPDSEFEAYAQDYAEDVTELGDMSMYIDWERYADDLKVDYTTVEFDGDTFYYRA